MSLDFVTHLPLTARGFDSVLVVVCKFSKLVVCMPCTAEITAYDTPRLFFDNVVCKFGVPAKIISDRDTRFTSLFWQALFKLLQVKLNLSSAYHP